VDGGEDTRSPCGRCGRWQPAAELRRLWPVPVWVMTLSLARPRDEGQRLYCPHCRRVLNRCVLFLALLGVAGVCLKAVGFVPGR
jgi:hypothetical protein